MMIVFLISGSTAITAVAAVHMAVSARREPLLIHMLS
jgi:hypothetical protein